jgi:group I intron endonuclease
MIVYEIRNKINNKIYVGKYSKCNTNSEFQKTKYWGSGKYIKNAIQKYGIENFERNVIVENISDSNEWNNLEVLWVKNKNSKYPNGYNLTDGGDGNLGWHPSEETKRKQRKPHLSMQGKPLPEIHRKKISDSGKGKHFASEETKRKMRENHADFSGEKHHNYGKPMSEEQKEKIKLSLKGRYTGVNNPNYRHGGYC